MESTHYSPVSFASKNKRWSMPSTVVFQTPQPPPPLPPKATVAGRSDSSWITKPSSAKEQHQRTKKSTAMKGMTRAFVESMRCSLEEAETKTSKEERIDGIDFGKLLMALEAMKDCMNTYGMKRTVDDLEHHCCNAKMLYMATPPDSRDYLSCLLQQNPLSESTHRTSKGDSNNNNSNNNDKNNNQFNMPFVRGFSMASSPDEAHSSTSPLTPEPRAESCSTAVPSATTTTTTQKDLLSGLSPNNASPEKTIGGQPPPCSLDALDRKKAINSMFWLCYFVRYTYNVHRLVLQVGHDAVDASPMAFMKYLHPYFGDFYTENKDAKAFLQLLRDYQKENYLDTAGGLDSQAMLELKSFLRVLEVVMYMWTPAFQEMAI